jgi:NAD(P)-dependent dehydrogenase (short-subunit alcohol dehydrogenase family)
MTGKVALVTGASSGIGRATARLFAARGARVVVADVNVDGSLETIELISEAGGAASFIPTDVTQAKQVAAAVNHAVTTYGRLDYAVNNAGIEGAQAPAADYPEDAWRRVIDTNLTGVWLCMKYELPQILKQQGGAIVNIASFLGLVGTAYASAYVAAKHGVIGLTKAAAVEYSAQGVRINAVSPGYVDTPMVARTGVMNDPQIRTMIERMHPIGRIGQPEEIAEAVVWLCEPSASFVTGQTLQVDGGYVAQ